MKTLSPAFTLLEILIVLAITLLLGSFFATQSISSFQFAVERLNAQTQSLIEEVRAGELLRHISGRGIATIELLIALALLVLVITTSSLVALHVPGVIADSKNLIAAVAQVRAVLAEDTNTSTIPLEDEYFSRHIATSTWSTWHSTNRSVSLERISNDIPFRSVCDPFTSGDWSKPALIATYPFTSMTISGLSLTPQALAVTAASTSFATNPSILFFSLTGTSSPQQAGSYDNAPVSRIGMNDVVADGTTFYAANAFTSTSTTTCSDSFSCAQVQVFSVRNQNSARLSSITLATSAPPYALSAFGKGASANSVAYGSGYLYLGLQKTVRGDEFNILDAHDPTHLRWLSGYAVGRGVQDIMIRGSFAYLSTDDPTRELIILNVQDPVHPRLVSSWDAPGASTFGYGSASTAYEQSIRFGRTYSPSSPEFQLLNISRDEVITETQNIDSGTTKDPESVRALLTQDRYTFVLLSHRVEVIDTHDHATVQRIGTYALPSGSQGAALSCRNNQLYVARTNDDGLSYIDILQGL